ncbi:restriction endonuclease subunit S [Micromonospora cathayae]|uniref:Restriction endonuclease subunit S n=1 Tax=Micromonospora cathayae TaxID=3028804 RepID=A0ABY7ZN02_9ACTN|nr:restriction endonuclease subunit S [Micromonospora sp. HUAS 3]WDZ84285.1 restriction endonuclease subunit S [Micromonospora sp. HUAS 3]
MTDLPTGWEWARLDEVAEVRLGRQRSPKNHTGTQMRPYLRAANVGWNGLKLDDVKEMNFTDEEVEVYRLRPGDIVLSEASGSPGEVGKPALWNDEIEGCCFQNTLLRVRSWGPDPKYLLNLLRFEAMRGAFVEHSRGVGIHHIGAGRLSSWRIPLPSLAEQRRVVALLDGQLSGLESGLDALLLSGRRLRTLTKAILAEAIPLNLPGNWRCVSVGEAGAVDLGRQRHPDWHTGPHMRPYLRVANVFEGRIDVSDVMEMDFPPEVFEKFRLREGDILLNEGQSPEYLGRPAIYRGAPEEVAFTNSLLRFRAGPGVDPEWALLVFRRHMHTGRYIRELRITTNIAHLSAGRFKAVEFPVPPLDEQREIVARVNEQLAGVERLRKEIEDGERRIAALRKSLLAEAFSGRLVPQDPDDEPASELLARIRAERAVRIPKQRNRAPRRKKELPAPPTRVTGDDYQQETLPL